MVASECCYWLHHCLCLFVAPAFIWFITEDLLSRLRLILAINFEEIKTALYHFINLQPAKPFCRPPGLMLHKRSRRPVILSNPGPRVYFCQQAANKPMISCAILVVITL